MREKLDVRQLSALATARGGVVTRDDLRPLSDAGVNRLVARGWLHPLHRGVYAVGHTALSFETRCRAAVLATGGVLSHGPAAVVWRVLDACDGLHVILATDAGVKQRAGIRVHRQMLREDETTGRFGFACTTLPRTLCDLAASVDPRVLGEAFEQAQVRHKLQPSFMAAELLVRPRRRGNAALGRLVAEAVDPGEVESVLELRFLAFCAKHGLPRPRTQVGSGRWRVDFRWDGLALVVETDSALWHTTRSSRRRDAAKDSDLVERGDRVVRVRWADIHQRPVETAAMLAAALDERRETLARRKKGDVRR